MAKVSISKGSVEHHLTANEKEGYCRFIQITTQLSTLILDNRKTLLNNQQLLTLMLELAETLDGMVHLAFRSMRFIKSLPEKETK